MLSVCVETSISLTAIHDLESPSPPNANLRAFLLAAVPRIGIQRVDNGALPPVRCGSFGMKRTSLYNSIL